MENKLKGKKVLLVGLGILGGGVATAKWLLKQGVILTITDLRGRKELKNSLQELGAARRRVRFVFGRHEVSDFTSHDLIVINPAVKIIGNKFLSAARRAGVPIINDLTIFLEYVKNPVVAVTGTRGKTTTANWIAYFFGSKYAGVKAGGNSSDEAFLKLLSGLEKNRKLPAVLELSSFQLELLPYGYCSNFFSQLVDNSRELSSGSRAPDVAVITNLYRDHINRHTTMKNYALAKANIFKNQANNQKLILNYDNEWTKFFLKQRPKSKVYFVSAGKLPKGLRGLIISRVCAPMSTPPNHQPFLIRANRKIRKIVFCDGRRVENVFGEETLRQVEALGEHNLYNFLFAALAARLMGISWKEIELRAKNLPRIRYRQEVILQRKNLVIVNDSAGTSPDATVAAIRRFSKAGDLILITGGTDKKLEFRALAREIKKTVKQANLFLLNGSATKKMAKELEKLRFFKNTQPQLFESLQEILRRIKNKELRIRGAKTITPYSRFIILFSPGAASFEKFKNEFDRGEKFNLYSKKFFN